MRDERVKGVKKLLMEMMGRGMRPNVETYVVVFICVGGEGGRGEESVGGDEGKRVCG